MPATVLQNKPDMGHVLLPKIPPELRNQTALHRALEILGAFDHRRPGGMRAAREKLVALAHGDTVGIPSRDTLRNWYERGKVPPWASATVVRALIEVSGESERALREGVSDMMVAAFRKAQKG